MTTPTTNTKPNANAPANAPAGKPANAPAGKPATPKLEIGSLSFTDTAAPIRKPSRQRDPELLKPFIAQMRDSWSKRDAAGKGSGKQVTIPKVHATKVAGYIRAAADELGKELGAEIGAAVVTTENGSNATIQFCAKKRRQRKAATKTTK